MHGFGALDRYLESLLCMTQLTAALSMAKVLLFNAHSEVPDNFTRLYQELDKERTDSIVWKTMHKDYIKPFVLVFTLAVCVMLTAVRNVLR